jgi:glycosyltransferase involved in cell wall biosynthesis
MTLILMMLVKNKIIQLLEKIEYVLKNNYEIVIVDDGSTDNSLSLVRAYKRNNEKLYKF